MRQLKLINMNKGELIISKDAVWYEYLFPVFADHGLILTQSEMMDIIYEIHKVTTNETKRGD